jgi:hypothetical protein
MNKNKATQFKPGQSGTPLAEGGKQSWIIRRYMSFAYDKNATKYRRR